MRTLQVQLGKAVEWSLEAIQVEEGRTEERKRAEECLEYVRDILKGVDVGEVDEERLVQRRRRRADGGEGGEVVMGSAPSSATSSPANKRTVDLAAPTAVPSGSSPSASPRPVLNAQQQQQASPSSSATNRPAVAISGGRTIRGAAGPVSATAGIPRTSPFSRYESPNANLRPSAVPGGGGGRQNNAASQHQQSAFAARTPVGSVSGQQSLHSRSPSQPLLASARGIGAPKQTGQAAPSDPLGVL